MFKKEQGFESSYDNEIYEFIGKWSGSIVLAPENDEDGEILIYTENDINELMDEGKQKMVNSPEILMS